MVNIFHFSVPQYDNFEAKRKLLSQQKNSETVLYEQKLKRLLPLIVGEY